MPIALGPLYLFFLKPQTSYLFFFTSTLIRLWCCLHPSALWRGQALAAALSRAGWKMAPFTCSWCVVSSNLIYFASALARVNLLRATDFAAVFGCVCSSSLGRLMGCFTFFFGKTAPQPRSFSTSLFPFVPLTLPSNRLMLQTSHACPSAPRLNLPTTTTLPLLPRVRFCLHPAVPTTACACTISR